MAMGRVGDRRCLIAHNFPELNIPGYLEWLLFVGIIEEGYGWRFGVQGKNLAGLPIIGVGISSASSSEINEVGGRGWLDIVGQSCRKMTFVRVVLLLVGLWHCTYQRRCSAAVE